MFSLICARINGRVNNGEAGYLRRHQAHYDDTVMDKSSYTFLIICVKNPTIVAVHGLLAAEKNIIIYDLKT